MNRGWTPADESASIAEANARYGQQRAEAAIERLAKRVSELESLLGVEPPEDPPIQNQTLIETVDGYPPRSQASDPDKSVGWFGWNPPRMGPDGARNGDAWTQPSLRQAAQ